MTSTSSGCLLEPATGFAGSLMTIALSRGLDCASASVSRSSSVYWLNLPCDGAVVDPTALSGHGGGHMTCLAAACFATSFHVTPVVVFSDGHLAMWGLLKVFLPKACPQWSLCRQSLAQLFEATAELDLWQRVNLTNMKECVIWCDCDCDCDLLLVLDWMYCWVLDFLELALT